jgi:hypothetical protein
MLTPLADPASIPGLAAVLDAAARGAKLSRLRLLDIACPESHRLAQVIATPAPVLYARGRDEPRSHGRQFGALALDGLPPYARVCVLCRCRQAWLPVSFMTDRIAAGIRRAAYPQ